MHSAQLGRSSAFIAYRPVSLLRTRNSFVKQSGLELVGRSGSRSTVSLQMSTKSASQQIVIAVIAFGFLFGAIYPLANNSLRFATADKSLSGAATKMRQSEIDDRLRTVPVFAVTDDKNSPYVAEGQVCCDFMPFFPGEEILVQALGMLWDSHALFKIHGMYKYVVSIFLLICSVGHFEVLVCLCLLYVMETNT